MRHQVRLGMTMITMAIVVFMALHGADPVSLILGERQVLVELSSGIRPSWYRRFISAHASMVPGL